MVILIPAYKPDERLIGLIEDIKAQSSYQIVIVNDGSGEQYNEIFNEAVTLGCDVVNHEVNRGKGQALKTGFEYIKSMKENEGIVCADCDGQHLIGDIIKIAKAIKMNPKHVILGTRRFVGNVPFRSKAGNTITRLVFSIVTGTKVYDTQTGLRGFSIDMIDWLCLIDGERYEYEMNMLLDAKASGYKFHEVDIETIYLEENKSSHFNTIKDSARIYLPILKFGCSSILSAILDFLLLCLFQKITNNLLVSVIGARLCSATFNYIVNRLYVFGNKNRVSVRQSLRKYALLAGGLMIINYFIIYFYCNILGMSLLLGKILTEITIYCFSYIIQRKYVFAIS